LNSNTTGGYNIAIGYESLSLNTTGSHNIGLGYGVQSGNYSNSVIIGRGATASGNNQFSVGSSSYNVGTLTSENCTISNNTWSVIINGVPHKILLA
jgi:hypothetical protein